MIKLKNISKSFESVKAVDDLSLDISKGEVVGILGPNGAGKSTTIRIICSFLEADSGDVSVDGIRVAENSRAVKSLIGYLPESAPLYADMRVFDYLYFIASVHGLSAKVFRERLASLSGLCGIKEVMHKNIFALSKGYRQRVGLAHALIGDPEILILDEPSSGLDPNQIIEIRKLIRTIAKSKTILLSSHILSEVEATCDRVVIINKGKIVGDSPTGSLASMIGARQQISIVLAIPSEERALQFKKEIESSMPSIQDLQWEKTKEGYAFTVYSTDEADIRPSLYRNLKQGDWPLLAFYKQSETLEGVFRELTSEKTSEK